ncbi:hypothetical protein Hbal_2441 [Hirschia baltica ATCC 49814]|uniref:Uncharacterized protein n=1 Tax=Hirschia baltica (strain ATCC 49814 / DSM 5838 / IFAM 1418) TaxID=582402 RepID=C6XNH7_HIRBI|nr:hypothetical protein Hbal_2441 [Hirschia baltica ATCC 49814]
MMIFCPALREISGVDISKLILHEQNAAILGIFNP